MEELDLVSLQAPDDRSLAFTPFGLSASGRMTAEGAVEWQTRAIARARLCDVVPDTVRSNFERLRRCHVYGVLWYDAFTVASDLTHVVLEHALRERFIDFYDRNLPVVDKKGSTESTVAVSTFEDVQKLKRRRKKETPQLRPRTDGPPLDLPTTLKPLLKWARRERLLDGQWNRVREHHAAKARNDFAHGTGYKVIGPVESAGDICDLAETINRLWGELTPGGRLHPAPLAREPIAIAWRHASLGPELSQMRPSQIGAEPDDASWTYIILLAAPEDPDLMEFDSAFELTSYPSELLWGPGDAAAAVKWWTTSPDRHDVAGHLDRIFAVQKTATQTFLPRTPSTFASLLHDDRSGTWYLVQADYPMKAFGHVRRADGSSHDVNSDGDCRDCPARVVGTGTWDEMRRLVGDDVRVLDQRHRVAVPRMLDLPPEVGG
jgi:hypothetical protein